jgi:hypothetical protein
MAVSALKRTVGVVGALALVAAGSACGAGHHTHGTHSAGPDSHGSASITIDHHQRSLDVTSCTRQAHAVHVVAQADGGWTLDLRSDRVNHNTMLVLVHNASSGVRSYQASANVLHPRGNPPSKIEVKQDGTHLSGSATLLGAPAKTSGAKRGAATTTASFEVRCASILPTT